MFSALTPVFLLGIPASFLFLIILYRNRTSFKNITVGTHFILSTLTATSKKKKLFNFPLRFFFDLIILSLFFLIFSKIFFKEVSKVKTIILDNSFSTNAYGISGNKRISDIRAKALSFMNDNQSSLFNIYTSTPNLMLIAKEANIDFAKRVIANIGPVNKSFTINIDQLKSTDITIIGDGALESNSVVNYQSVFDKPLNNIAIDSVTEASLNTIDVKLVNFSAKNLNRNGILNLYKNENEFIESQDIIFNNNRDINASFKIQDSGDYLLKFSTKDFDSIKEDNEFKFKIDVKAKIIGVYSNRGKAELGLNKLGSFKFISLKEYPKANVLFKIYDSVILNKITIASKSNIFLNLPKSDGDFFDIKNTANEIEISYWDKSAPLLNYLDFSDIKLNKAISFNPKNNSKSLIGSVNGSHLVSSDSENKTIISGFDIFPFNPNTNKFKSILLLNIFKELSSSKLHVYKRNLVNKEYDTYNKELLSLSASVIKDSNEVQASFLISSNLIKLLILLLIFDLVYLFYKELFFKLKRSRA